VAILMTLVCHYYLGLGDETSRSSFMGRGVDLFFVLSGFLISGLIFKEFQQRGSIDVKRFWIRRGFKIYPPFYVFTIVTWISWRSLFGEGPGGTIYEIFFLQNYHHTLWPHTWSLAVEEHFYLFLPLLLVGLARVGKNKQNPFRLVPLLSMVISALCLYGRIYALRHGSTWTDIAYPTHLRIDALFAGVTLGYFAHFDGESFAEARKWWVLFIGLLFALTLPVLPGVPQLTFAYVGFSFIVAWTVNHPDLLWFRPLRWIGRYSYSIYLWHVVPMMLVAHVSPHWFRFPAYAISAILLGLGMAKLIEFPSLFFRDKFFPSAAHGLPESTDIEASRVTTTSCDRQGVPHAGETLPVVGA